MDITTKIGRLLLTATLALTSNSFAAGFSVSPRGTASLGNAFAGSAAYVEDAAVVFNNPAGMEQLPGNNMVVALHILQPDTRYIDSNSGDSYEPKNDKRYIPNLYYSGEISPSSHLGLAIYSPWGLGIDWGNEWPGKYYSSESNVRTINFSPGLSYRLAPELTLGATLDAQYAEATLARSVLPQQGGGEYKLSGDSWAYGLSLGLHYDSGEATQVGLSYHSSTHHNIDATAELSASSFETPADISFHLPETLSLSVAHAIDERMTLLADYTHTGWSRYQELTVRHETLLGTQSEEKDWSDSYRLSFGTTYQVTPPLKVRLGYAYDQSPVPDRTRGPRVPDGNRHWFALGLGYRSSAALTIDVAYVRILVDPVESRLNGLSGSYRNNSQYFSIQARLHW